MHRLHLPLLPLLALLPLILLFRIAPAAAQALPPAPPTAEQEDLEARDTLVWHPSYGVTSFGYDSNVFNLPDTTTGNGTTGDWVASFAAGLSPIWNVGDVKISADTGLVYNYFRTFATERGFDGTARGRIDIPIARVKLHMGGGYANLRQRVNFEIDQRARRSEQDANAGLDIALGGRTTVGLGVRRGVIRFADDLDTPQSLTLRETLNREERAASASVQYAITPLTTWITVGEIGTHHFQLSPGRDGDSSSYSTGFTFGQDAAVAGQALVGWRRVTVTNPLIPAYSGVAWSLDLSTVIGQGTRIGARGRRDVSFSSDEQSPYYVQSSVGVSLKQILGEGWEVGIRGDRVWLDYTHSLIDTTPAYAEKVNVLGASFGYRFRGDVRLALEVESQRRQPNNNAPGRAYSTLRTYTVISKSIGSR